MASIEKLKKKIIIALKLNGYTIRSEFAVLIMESFDKVSINLADNFEHYIKIICDYLEKHVESEKCIERHHIVNSIEACIHIGSDESDTKFSVINAFDYPNIQYDISRKHYFIDSTNKPKIIANGDMKNKLFIQRYKNVLQRAERSFKTKNLGLDDNEKFGLYTVDSLLTTSHKLLERNFILGSLFQKCSGKYFIEDPTGMIELDLKHTKYHTGFFYENMIVLVNGIYTDKILQVSTMMLPPAEEFKDSKIMFTHLNYFGGKSESLLRESNKLNQIMQENPENMIVFVSDLWLDKEQVFEKLEKLFEGFADNPPIAFIFIGNFLSQCYAQETFSILQRGLKRLAGLIQKFSELKSSQFVFVPGMNDPCMPHILPRIPLPTLVTKDFQKTVPNSIFTTNPCRIQYCTREIVIYRNDLLAKFMQDSLNKPTKNKLDDFVTKTILSQAHLAPFSLNSQPVHWGYDFSLHLYPLPNLVVVGDKCNPYEGKYKDCTLINPGCFTESGFSFKTYIPSSDTIEDCSI